MKVCTQCHLEKPLDDFHKSPKSKDGRASACKLCKKVIDAASHQKHRSKRLDKRREDRKATRAWVQSLKHYKSCTDCGIEHPHWRMDWDHLPGSQKLFDLGTCTNVVGDNGRQRILEEIAKCELVCANCHRDRTYYRRMGVSEQTSLL